MATANPNPNQRQIFDKRVTTSEGHYARWEISLRDLHLLRDWHFSKNYRTFCDVNPTTWDFMLRADEVRDDGSAQLSFRLTRRDSLEVEMDASVWVDISDLREDEIFPRQSFTRHQMVGADQFAETFELEPYPYMAQAVNESVVVLVTLTVANCHPMGAVF